MPFCTKEISNDCLKLLSKNSRIIIASAKVTPISSRYKFEMVLNNSRCNIDHVAQLANAKIVMV